MSSISIHEKRRYFTPGNLLNRKYDEVGGYTAPGFNFVIGIKAKAF